MDLRDRAIGGIAVVEFCIRQIEKELSDAHRLAADNGIPGTLDAVIVAQTKVRKAHRALEALRDQLALSVGSPVETRSGGDGDDKDQPPEEPAP